MTESTPFAAPPPTCQFPVTVGRHCGQPSATVDGVTGRRCADHPPTFNAGTAVELMRRGLPGAAMAYLRAAS